MAIDAFLELKKGGKPAIEGETLDKIFGAKHRRAVQLISFELESQVNLASREAAAVPPATAPQTQSGQEHAEDSDDLLSDLGGDGKEQEDFFTFTISKDVDNATPTLFQYYCRHWTATRSPGKTDADDADIFDEAKVTVRKAGGTGPVEYLVFEFRQVWIRSWDLSHKDGEDLPEEEIEFAFDACQMRYWPQRATGARGVMIPSGFFDFRASQGE